MTDRMAQIDALCLSSPDHTDAPLLSLGQPLCPSLGVVAQSLIVRIEPAHELLPLDGVNRSVHDADDWGLPAFAKDWRR